MDDIYNTMFGEFVNLLKSLNWVRLWVNLSDETHINIIYLPQGNNQKSWTELTVSIIINGPSKASAHVPLLFLHSLCVWVINIVFRSDESVFHLPHFDN